MGFYLNKPKKKIYKMSNSLLLDVFKDLEKSQSPIEDGKSKKKHSSSKRSKYSRHRSKSRDRDRRRKKSYDRERKRKRSRSGSRHRRHKRSRSGSHQKNNKYDVLGRKSSGINSKEEDDELREAIERQRKIQKKEVEDREIEEQVAKRVAEIVEMKIAEEVKR